MTKDKAAASDEQHRNILGRQDIIMAFSGESGIGTYYWDDGLCYLFYAPIPSKNWVLLTVIIIYWIVSNFKKTAEINRKWNIIANYDPLTGTLN